MIFLRYPAATVGLFTSLLHLHFCHFPVYSRSKVNEHFTTPCFGRCHSILDRLFPYETLLQVQGLFAGLFLLNVRSVSHTYATPRGEHVRNRPDMCKKKKKKKILCVCVLLLLFFVVVFCFFTQIFPVLRTSGEKRVL